MSDVVAQLVRALTSGLCRAELHKFEPRPTFLPFTVCVRSLVLPL